MGSECLLGPTHIRTPGPNPNPFYSIPFHTGVLLPTAKCGTARPPPTPHLTEVLSPRERKACRTCPALPSQHQCRKSRSSTRSCSSRKLTQLKNSRKDDDRVRLCENLADNYRFEAEQAVQVARTCEFFAGTVHAMAALQGSAVDLAAFNEAALQMCKFPEDRARDVRDALVGV